MHVFIPRLLVSHDKLGSCPGENLFMQKLEDALINAKKNSSHHKMKLTKVFAIAKAGCE